MSIRISFCNDFINDTMLPWHLYHTNSLPASHNSTHSPEETHSKAWGAESQVPVMVSSLECLAKKHQKTWGFLGGSDVRHSFNSMSFVVTLMFAAEVPNAVPKAHLALFHSPGPPRRMLRYVHGSHFLGNPTQKERTKRNHNLCPYKIPVLTLKYEYAETMWS